MVLASGFFLLFVVVVVLPVFDLQAVVAT